MGEEETLFTAKDGLQVVRMPNGYLAITDGYLTDYFRVDSPGAWVRESDQLLIGDDLRAFLDGMGLSDAPEIASPQRVGP